MPKFKTPLYRRIYNIINSMKPGSIRRKLMNEAEKNVPNDDMVLCLVDLLCALILLRITTCVEENGTSPKAELRAITDDFIKGSVIVAAPGPPVEHMTLQ